MELQLIPYKRGRAKRSVREHKTLARMLCWMAAWPQRATDPCKLPCQHQHLEFDTSKCWQPDAYIKVVSLHWCVFFSPLSSSSLQIITVFSRPLTSCPGTKVGLLVSPAVWAVLGFTHVWCQGPLHVSPVTTRDRISLPPSVYIISTSEAKMCFRFKKTFRPSGSPCYIFSTGNRRQP